MIHLVRMALPVSSNGAAQGSLSLPLSAKNYALQGTLLHQRGMFWHGLAGSSCDKIVITVDPWGGLIELSSVWSHR
jgi:hypothetical protein